MPALIRLVPSVIVPLSGAKTAPSRLSSEATVKPSVPPVKTFPVLVSVPAIVRSVAPLPVTKRPALTNEPSVRLAASAAIAAPASVVSTVEGPSIVRRADGAPAAACAAMTPLPVADTAKAVPVL